MIQRARTPLKILVVGTVHPEITALVSQGHEVTMGATLLQYDLILGPNCARYLPGMEPFLPQCLKGAQVGKRKKSG